MKTFTVYGRPGCGYCVAATRLLETQGHPFDYVDIFAEGISTSQLAEIVGRQVWTVPQVMHGEHYIGGYRELVPYLKEVQAA